MGSKNLYHRSDGSVIASRLNDQINLPLSSGYIGGHQLAPLLKQHSEYLVVALVRNEDQSNVVKAAYPNVETIVGDLDSDEVLISEAGKADVVLST
jgi:uncharacterized protein YbjT (DUF2867 family)